MNIKELIDHFQLKAGTNGSSNFEKNVHKAYNKYLKDYSNTNPTVEEFFKDEYKSYINYLQTSQLSPNTIRNYISYIFESLSTEIIKSSIQQDVLISVTQYLQPIVSSVTKKANEYQKMLEIQVKTKSDIDINEIVPIDVDVQDIPDVPEMQEPRMINEFRERRKSQEIIHLSACNNRLEDEVEWLRKLVFHMTGVRCSEPVNI